MNFQYQFNSEAVRLTALPKRSGLLGLVMRSRPVQLDMLKQDEQRLALALADLKALAEQLNERLDISGDTIIMSHRICAALDSHCAKQLGLPGLTDYVLETDVSGLIGRSDFKLTTRWLRKGQPRMPRRTGAFIGAPGQEKRIPEWMFDALEVSDNYQASANDAMHWEALARFRKALDPGVDISSDDDAARISMSDFLQKLQVSLTDQFSLSPNQSGEDFEVVPFARKRGNDVNVLSELDAELLGEELSLFQEKFRERGPLNAFRLSPGRFLVVDRSAMSALRVMSEMQHAPLEQRRQFIRNPREEISKAVEAELMRSPDYLALDPAEQQEENDRLSDPLFVETEEYSEFSERVIGVELYQGNPLQEFGSSGTTWYPENFPEAIIQELEALGASDLENLSDQITKAIEDKQPYVLLGNQQLPADDASLGVIKEFIARKTSERDSRDNDQLSLSAPLVLQTKVNFEDLTWAAKLARRTSQLGSIVPSAIITRLKDHQVESLNWQIEAWKAGLPGGLNADEQGLGKTLQTISFLVWLNEHMKLTSTGKPMLIVAPTSLLRNWEEEVERHVERPGLGQLVRLYGAATQARRFTGTEGKDIDDGSNKLDLSDLSKSVRSGTGHLTWVLTTYQTLTNYQHSLARIPFAAAVFDEIQNIKNPGTLAAHAVRAMNSDFRIGLTGTPIENATFDLWAIMDQLVPGALGTLQEFKAAYGKPEEENMTHLHAKVFKPQNGLPPLALRRLKVEVAGDLPAKTRLLHPRLMPDGQAMRYDEARIKLAAGGKGKALKMLHHIRGVSVHPDIDDRASHDNYVAASARLSATFDVLRTIQRRRERVLVFIEHRKMQYRFIELVKAEFGLSRVDLINGDTEIKKRQEIVNRFQAHLSTGPAFDVLVLAPKAAGTGLTLTAATHVIHLSRWWNPAVEEQCNDRVHRIGQTRQVTVHLPQAIHPNLRESSFDLLLHSLMQRKRRMASAALWPMGESGDELGSLQRLLETEAQAAAGEPVEAAMLALFARDEVEPVARHPDRSWEFL